MELGNTQKKDSLDYEQKFDNIDPGFFHIQFSINGKIFQKAVDGLIAFEKEDLKELSDQALDEALNDCSYWRYTFISAAQELEQRLMTEERRFNTWYAKATEDARRTVIKNRQYMIKNQGVARGWFGSITKQEMEQAVLNDALSAQTYEDYHFNMSEIRKNVKLLNGLRDVLQDRGGYLQSIGRRRLENKKLRFLVRGSE